MAGLIILEGVDATGKSTLAKNLEFYAEEKGIPAHIWHLTYRFKKNMAEYMFSQFNEAVFHAARGGFAIIDRLWVSENIYARILRNGVTFNGKSHTANMLYKMSCSLGALNVLCFGQKYNDAERYSKNIDRTHPYEFEKWEKLWRAHYDLYYGCHTTKETTLKPAFVKGSRFNPNNNSHVDFAARLSRKGVEHSPYWAHYTLGKEGEVKRLFDKATELWRMQ